MGGASGKSKWLWLGVNLMVEFRARVEVLVKIRHR